MRYFNNLFICSYRVYKKREKYSDPRFTSTALVCVCINGLVFMLVEIALQISAFPKSANSFAYKHPFLVIGLIISEAVFVYGYYNEKRIANLDSSFEKKTLLNRRIWGFLIVATLIIPVVIGALLIAKNQ